MPRPTKPAGKKLDTRITLRLTPEQHAATLAYAEENGLEPSSVARQALVQKLKSEGFLESAPKKGDAPVGVRFLASTAERRR